MTKLTLTYHFETEAELLAHLQRNTVAAPPLPVIEPDKVPAKKSAPAVKPAATPPTATGVADAAPAKTAAESAPTAEPAAAEPQASTAATDATYADLSKAVTAVLKLTTPPEAVKVAQELGAKNFKELPQEKYAEAIQKLETLAAELVAKKGGV